MAPFCHSDAYGSTKSSHIQRYCGTNVQMKIKSSVERGSQTANRSPDYLFCTCDKSPLRIRRQRLEVRHLFATVRVVPPHFVFVASPVHDLNDCPLVPFRPAVVKFPLHFDTFSDVELVDGVPRVSSDWTRCSILNVCEAAQNP
jgi:hypothetical protein